MPKKKKTVDEKLSDALDVNMEEKTEKEYMEIVHDGEGAGGFPIVPQGENPHVDKDYTSVRKNLREIIETGKTALDGILEVASEGESPRAYEVAAIIMKQMTEANNDLIGLHQKLKDIRKFEKGGGQSAQSITNNAIYLGSTKDLQQFLEAKQEENENIIDAEVVDNDGQTDT
tara:strand:+ start:171 stop:689 length:519 start_codon:yes stop_codon:yes gene_type:complete